MRKNDWRSCKVLARPWDAGAALGESRRRDQSYREVVEWSSGSDYEVSVVEQLANCEFRVAHKRFRIVGAATPEVTRDLRRGRQEAHRLAEPRTDQRALGLRGSYHKKRATTLDDKARTAESCRLRRVSRGRGGRSDPYSSLNRLQLGELLESRFPKRCADGRGCGAANRKYRGTTTCRRGRLLASSRSGRRPAHPASKQRTRARMPKLHREYCIGLRRTVDSGASVTRRSATSGTSHDSIRSRPKQARDEPEPAPEHGLAGRDVNRRVCSHGAVGRSKRVASMTVTRPVSRALQPTNCRAPEARSLQGRTAGPDQRSWIRSRDVLRWDGPISSCARCVEQRRGARGHASLLWCRGAGPVPVDVSPRWPRYSISY